MKFIVYLTLILLLSVNTMNGIMSAIVTNSNTKVFKEAGKKALVDYKFEDREIIFIEAITNIEGKNWYYFNRKSKKVSGWITGEFGEVYTNENDVANYIISNEVYYTYNKVWDDLYNVRIVDYKNNYWSIYFQMSDGISGDCILSVYLKEGNNVKKVIDDSIGENIIFKEGFVIIHDESWIGIYNSQQLTKDDYKELEYYRLTYKLNSWKFESNEEFRLKKKLKSYLTFDEQSGMLTVYLDYKSGIKKEFKYIFKEGTFELLSQSEFTNSWGYHILTGNNVNVRAEATTNSKVLLQLKKGTKVKVLDRSDIEFTTVDGKTGYWVYIDTGVKDKKGKTIKGWVVDVYLKPEE